MPIKVLYNDLRTIPAQFEWDVVNWHTGLTAQKAYECALGSTATERITQDLARDDPEIFVSWVNMVTNAHSDIGGVGSLDWEVDDWSILVVTYEGSGTNERVIDAVIEWMLSIEQASW